MMLTYGTKLRIWTDIVNHLARSENVIILTAGMLYEEIAPFVMASTQFLKTKPIVRSNSGAWTAYLNDCRAELYDVSDPAQIELLIERHIMSEAIIHKVLMYEIAGNTLVMDAYENRLATMFEAKEYTIEVQRIRIDG